MLQKSILRTPNSYTLDSQIFSRYGGRRENITQFYVSLLA